MIAFYLHGVLFAAGWFSRQLFKIRADTGYQPPLDWLIDILVAVFFVIFWPISFIYIIWCEFTK